MAQTLPSGRRIVVTRHAGAEQWLAGQGIVADLVLTELDPAMIVAGDLVIGTLPVHLAALVGERGGRFWHLAMDVPLVRSGESFNAEEMARHGARLIEYRVTEERPVQLRPVEVQSARQVLITVLGGVGASVGAYQLATYDFGDRPIEANWFPAALLAHQRSMASATPIARLVVLGTPGSMWDVLVRQFGGEEPELETALWDAAVDNRASEALLAPLARRLAAESGLAVELRIIPYITDLTQAFTLVETVARCVQPGEAAIIDVTHGLRHLAIALMLGGFVLQDTGRGQIAGLTYGARELSKDGGPAPVLRLEGLTELIRWIRALTVLQSSGDLRPVAALLDNGSGELRRAINAESFDARTLDVHAAANGARACLFMLRRRKDPIVRLFRHTLENHLAWAEGANTLAERQAALARRALAAEDFVRATLMSFEAILTTMMEEDPSLEGRDIESSRQRGKAQERYTDLKGRIAPHTPRDAQANAYMRIKAIRNVLAHASFEVNKRAADDLNNAATLKAAITACLDSFGLGLNA
jgi:CRISPR-associated Csx2 family protein